MLVGQFSISGQRQFLICDLAVLSINLLLSLIDDFLLLLDRLGLKRHGLMLISGDSSDQRDDIHDRDGLTIPVGDEIRNILRNKSDARFRSGVVSINVLHRDQLLQRRGGLLAIQFDNLIFQSTAG